MCNPENIAQVMTESNNSDSIELANFDMTETSTSSSSSDSKTAILESDIETTGPPPGLHLRNFAVAGDKLPIHSISRVIHPNMKLGKDCLVYLQDTNSKSISSESKSSSGSWYDITNFISQHPGGDIIAEYIGKDVTIPLRVWHPGKVFRNPMGFCKGDKGGVGGSSGSSMKKVNEEENVVVFWEELTKEEKRYVYENVLHSSNVVGESSDSNGSDSDSESRMVVMTEEGKKLEHIFGKSRNNDMDTESDYESELQRQCYGPSTSTNSDSDSCEISDDSNSETLNTLARDRTQTESTIAETADNNDSDESMTKSDESSDSGDDTFTFTFNATYNLPKHSLLHQHANGINGKNGKNLRIIYQGKSPRLELDDVEKDYLSLYTDFERLGFFHAGEFWTAWKFVNLFVKLYVTWILFRIPMVFDAMRILNHDSCNANNQNQNLGFFDSMNYIEIEVLNSETDLESSISTMLCSPFNFYLPSFLINFLLQYIYLPLYLSFPKLTGYIFHFLAAFFLELSWRESACFWHDCGHNQLFDGDIKKNDMVMQCVCAIFGISKSFWKWEHVEHHSFTQSIDTVTGGYIMVDDDDVESNSGSKKKLLLGHNSDPQLQENVWLSDRKQVRALCEGGDKNNRLGEDLEFLGSDFFYFLMVKMKIMKMIIWINRKLSKFSESSDANGSTTVAYPALSDSYIESLFQTYFTTLNGRRALILTIQSKAMIPLIILAGRFGIVIDSLKDEHRNIEFLTVYFHVVYCTLFLVPTITWCHINVTGSSDAFNNPSCLLCEPLSLLLSLFYSFHLYYVAGLFSSILALQLQVNHLEQPAWEKHSEMEKKRIICEEELQSMGVDLKVDGPHVDPKRKQQNVLTRVDPNEEGNEGIKEGTHEIWTGRSYNVEGCAWNIKELPPDSNDESNTDTSVKKYILEPKSWIQKEIEVSVNIDVLTSWFDWYWGGLNLHIEHHLFPRMCRQHYRNAREYIKDRLCLKHGIQYKEVYFSEGIKGFRNKLGVVGRDVDMIKCLVGGKLED